MLSTNILFVRRSSLFVFSFSSFIFIQSSYLFFFLFLFFLFANVRRIVSALLNKAPLFYSNFGVVLSATNFGRADRMSSEFEGTDGRKKTQEFIDERFQVFEKNFKGAYAN